MACSAKTIDKSKKNEMWVWVFVVPASIYKNNSIEIAIKESYNYLKEHEEEFISKCNNK